MKPKSKLILAVAAASATSLITGLAAEPAVGDDAPEFKLPGSDGETYELGAFKGKQAVVLSWFPKAFTGGWTAECESLRVGGDQIREYDVAYFAVGVDPMDGEKGMKAFAESMDLDYPILSDESKSVAKAYGVVTLDRAVPFRWTFFISKDGKVLFVDKEVKVGSHGADIAGKLKELGVAKKP